MDRTRRKAESLQEVKDELEAREARKAGQRRKLRAKKARRARLANRRQTFKNSVSDLSACVVRVHLDGLIRTNPNLILSIIQPVFAATNYGQLVDSVKNFHKDLRGLGCFERVDLVLDSGDDQGNRQDLELIVSVREYPRYSFRIEPRTSDWGDISLVLRGNSANIMGNGESIRAEIGQSLCSGTQERTLQFATQRLSTLFGGAYILARASWLKRGLPWRSLASSETSMRLTGMFQPFTWMENDISVAADFRHLKPLPGGQISLSALRECGHTFKTALSHQLTVDNRDDRVLPTAGLLLKWFKEVTGPLGNVDFFKHLLQANLSIPLCSRSGNRSSLCLSAKLGYLYPLVPSCHSFGDPFTSIDLLPMDNHLRCRSWNQHLRNSFELCPRKIQTLMALSAKLAFPLPLLRGSSGSWLMRNTQAHLFCDYGALGQADSIKQWMASPDNHWESLAAGVGIVVKLGDMGRAEINYCVPLKRDDGGRSCQGLQFGLSVNFL